MEAANKAQNVKLLDEECLNLHLFYRNDSARFRQNLLVVSRNQGRNRDIPFLTQRAEGNEGWKE